MSETPERRKAETVTASGNPIGGVYPHGCRQPPANPEPPAPTPAPEPTGEGELCLCGEDDCIHVQLSTALRRIEQLEAQLAEAQQGVQFYNRKAAEAQVLRDHDVAERDQTIARLTQERDRAIDERNRAAESGLAILLAKVEALENAKRFIENGIELGYIHMPDPDCPDSAHDTLPMIRAALAAPPPPKVTK